MFQRLTLVRGVPGSGKSTMAFDILKYDLPMGSRHFEADMYFLGPQGKYTFDGDKIRDAHGWCYASTRIALAQGRSVIVSNTFVRVWEMEHYRTLAQNFNIEFKVVEAKGNYGNVHDVPDDVVERMRSQWEEIPEHWGLTISMV